MLPILRVSMGTKTRMQAPRRGKPPAPTGEAETETGMEAAGMIAIAGTGIVGGSEKEAVGGIASGTAAATLAVEIAEKTTDGGTPCCA